MSPDAVCSIIRRFYFIWRRGRRLRAEVRRAAACVMDCRTSRLGAHVKRCDCGHISSIEYNSCRHRSCPQCQGGKRAEWLQKITSQLLPCEHAHLIFTVPEQLNVFWQFNRSVFAELLFQASRQTIETLLADPAHLGAKPGIISVLHTWGRNLSIHPHVHCLVTFGGVDRDGRFVRPQKSILVPARMLKVMFRGKLCDLLKQAVLSNRLVLPRSFTAAKAISLFHRLSRSDWNVRLQETYRHGCSVAGYLARYVCGSPISGRRVERVTADEVMFRYRDHRDGQQKLMKLSPQDFLTRWFEHVPPKGLRMIRRSGLYSNSSADCRAQICRQLNAESPAEAATAETARSGVRPLDREVCPVCNTEVRTTVLSQPLSDFVRRFSCFFPRGRPKIVGQRP